MWIEILAPVLAIVGVIGFARKSEAKHKSRERQVLWAWGLLLGALALQVYGAAGVQEAGLALSRTLGVSLLVGSLYLALNDVPAKGYLLLAASFLIFWGISSFVLVPMEQRQTDELMLELGPDDDIDEVSAILDRYDADAVEAFPNVTLSEDEDLAQYFIVTVDHENAEDLLEALAEDAENVDSIEPNRIVELPPEQEVEALGFAGEVESNDPRIHEQWAIRFAKIDRTYDLLDRSSPARKGSVAIADTGVDSQHEDIAGVYKRGATSQGHGRSAVFAWLMLIAGIGSVLVGIVFGSKSPELRSICLLVGFFLIRQFWATPPEANWDPNVDVQGHGTHCAGIAAAATNNGVGVASHNWNGQFVEVSSYKALSDSGRGSSEQVAQAIIDAAEDDVDVISLSLGGKRRTPPKVEVDAVEYALRRGSIVVAAAGNSDGDALDHSPANIPGVIVVSAIDERGYKASFSNTNTSLGRPIAAPGTKILSLKPNGQYVALSGTSMATPLVAGLLGVMRALDPNLSAAQAYDILKRTGREGRDVKRVGRTIDSEAAIGEVLRMRR